MHPQLIQFYLTRRRIESLISLGHNIQEISCFPAAPYASVSDILVLNDTAILQVGEVSYFCECQKPIKVYVSYSHPMWVQVQVYASASSILVCKCVFLCIYTNVFLKLMTRELQISENTFTFS